MHNAIEITNLIKHSDEWRIIFLSAGLLGIYLSIIIIGFLSKRKLLSQYLGFYTSALSIFLLQLSTIQVPIEQVSTILDSAGAGALYLIGPLSYHVFSGNTKKNRELYKFCVQFIPAILVSFLIQMKTLSLSPWIYLTGMLHMGVYLLIQSWIMFRKERITSDSWQQEEENHNWNKKFTGLQIALYSVSGLALACPIIHQEVFIASICLTILILTIWIRLMHTAIIHYIHKPDNQLTKSRRTKS